MRVIAYPVQSLSFTTPRVALGKELTLQWKLPWRVQPGRTRLLATRDNALLVNGEQGWFEIGNATPEAGTLAPWKRYDVRVADIGAAIDADALVLDSKGAVFRWQAGQSPEPVWRSEWPAAHTIVLGLSGGRLFAQCAADSRRSMGVVATQEGKFLWSQKGTGNWVLPVEDLLLMERNDTYNVLVALETSSGKQRWKSKPVRGGISTVIGVVDDMLWVATRESSLCALDLDNGGVRTEVQVKNNRVPLGRLDEEGRLHLCQGLNYQVLDLREGSKLLSYTEFRRTEKAPSTASGNLAWPVRDGRLVFHDDRGRVWSVSPETPAEPKLLWESPNGLAGIAVSHERLLILENGGSFMALGAEPSHVIRTVI